VFEQGGLADAGWAVDLDVAPVPQRLCQLGGLVLPTATSSLVTGRGCWSKRARFGRPPCALLGLDGPKLLQLAAELNNGVGAENVDVMVDLVGQIADDVDRLGEGDVPVWLSHVAYRP